MSHDEAQAARARLADAIQFKRKGGVYWYPDLLVDRHAIDLLGITYHPKKDEDEIITQFSGIAWIQFNHISEETIDTRAVSNNVGHSRAAWAKALGGEC